MLALLKVGVREVWQFVSRYGYLIATILGILASIIFLRGIPRNPSTDLNEALDRVKNENELKRLAAIKGNEAAVTKLETEYAETIKRMDEKQREEVAQLRADPVGLSRRLLRASRKS